MISNQNISISILTVHRLNNRVGGTERVIAEMASALSQRGYKVTILYCDSHRGTPFFPIDSSVIILNTFKDIPWYGHQFIRNLLSLSPNKEKKFKKRKELECKWKAANLSSYIKNNIKNIDIFVSFDFESTYILNTILNIKKPIITTLQTSPSLSFNSTKNSLLLPAINNCSTLHVLMPEFIQECRHYLDSVPIVCIPNAVTLVNKTNKSRKKTIICVSRYDPEKRIELLVEAFSLLSSKFPEWSVEVWGRFNGKNTENIRKLISKRKISNQFNLCGITDKISEKLSKSSIFVIPSQYEGFCISLIEAMSVGLATVGMSDCPAVSSLIKDGETGILSKPTANNLAASLEKLMTNQELRCTLGENAKQFSLNYKPDHIWSSWEKLINSLVIEN